MATSSTSTSGVSGGLDPISSIVGAGSAIATTIAGISDMNKRRKFEQALSLLSNRQQQELNEKLLRANTESDRLKILSESMTNYLIANQQAVEKNKLLMYVLAGFLAVTLLTVAVVLTRKKN